MLPDPRSDEPPWSMLTRDLLRPTMSLTASHETIRLYDAAGHELARPSTRDAIGMVGARAVMEGRGFAASRAVKVTFDGVLATSCATDLRGTLSGCAFVIPPEVPGAHRVAAIDSNGHGVSLPFTIT